MLLAPESKIVLSEKRRGSGRVPHGIHFVKDTAKMGGRRKKNVRSSVGEGVRSENRSERGDLSNKVWGATLYGGLDALMGLGKEEKQD